MKRVTQVLSIFTIVIMALALIPAGNVFAADPAVGPVTTAVTVTPNPVTLKSPPL